MGLSVSFLRPRRSSSMDVAAAPLHDGNYEAGTEQNGGAGLTKPLAEDEFSDSESESELELNPAAEALYKLGDGIWVHEKYLACLKKPKDLDILLFQNGKPGEEDHQWMAQAPEWPNALGFGSTKEEASEDLQSALVATKLMYIEDKDVDGIEMIPVRPCKERAEKARRNRWRASYYDKLEKKSTE